MKKKIKGNPFQRLSRKFICGAEDCENITLLISLECSQCHKKYCLQHADLLKEIESTNPSDKTYLCIDCKEKKYQSIGPIRSHTEEFKSARTLAIDNFKTSGAERVEKMKTQVNIISKENSNPIQSTFSSLSDSLFKNRVWSNVDTWSKCSQCDSFFDLLNVKQQCKLCAKDFCSKCGIFKVNFDPQLIGLKGNEKIITSACQKCRSIILYIKRKKKLDILRKKKYPVFEHYTVIYNLKQNMEEKISLLGNYITSNESENKINELDQELTNLFNDFHALIQENRHHISTLVNNPKARSTVRLLTLLNQWMINVLTQNKRLYSKTMIIHKGEIKN